MTSFPHHQIAEGLAEAQYRTDFYMTENSIGSILFHIGLMPIGAQYVFCWFYTLKLSLSGYPLGRCHSLLLGESSRLLMFAATPAALKQYCFCCFIFCIVTHPGGLTRSLQITHLERTLLFQTSMITFKVNLQGYADVYKNINTSGVLRKPQNNAFFVLTAWWHIFWPSGLMTTTTNRQPWHHRCPPLSISTRRILFRENKRSYTPWKNFTDLTS